MAASSLVASSLSCPKNYFTKGFIPSSRTSSLLKITTTETTSFSTEVIRGNNILISPVVRKKNLERVDHFYASVTAAAGSLGRGSAHGLHPHMLQGLVCLCILFGFWRLYTWVADQVLPVLKFLMFCMNTAVLGAVIQTMRMIVKDGLVNLEAGKSEELKEALMKWEKFMEDPTIQKLIYPYLPMKARINPMFKWMLQNPIYGQPQCMQQENIEESLEGDNCSVDTLNNFDLTNPDIKLQLDQIGSALEEVVLGMIYGPLRGGSWEAFSKPRFLAAISECAENPSSIAKYEQDKKVLKIMADLSVTVVGLRLPDACIPSLSALSF